MKLINHTRYETAALRRLVQAVYERHRKTEGKHNRWSAMVITVRTNRADYSGNAELGRFLVHGTRINLRLPRPLPFRIAAVRSPDGHVVTALNGAIVTTPNPQMARVRNVAALIEHELRHSYGEEHRRGHRCMSRNWSEREVDAQAWTDGMFPGDVIPLAAPKAKPARDLQGERYARTLELEKVWTTKLKRAQTALKKLRQRRRYYESAMAAKKGGTT